MVQAKLSPLRDLFPLAQQVRALCSMRLPPLSLLIAGPMIRLAHYRLDAQVMLQGAGCGLDVAHVLAQCMQADQPKHRSLNHLASPYVHVPSPVCM